MNKSWPDWPAFCVWTVFEKRIPGVYQADILDMYSQIQQIQPGKVCSRKACLKSFASKWLSREKKNPKLDGLRDRPFQKWNWPVFAFRKLTSPTA